MRGGDEISSYFNMDPPSLDAYLKWNGDVPAPPVEAQFSVKAKQCFSFFVFFLYGGGACLKIKTPYFLNVDNIILFLVFFCLEDDRF